MGIIRCDRTLGGAPEFALFNRAAGRMMPSRNGKGKDGRGETAELRTGAGGTAAPEIGPPRRTAGGQGRTAREGPAARREPEDGAEAAPASPAATMPADAAAMHRLGQALAFVCGPEHAATVAVQRAVASGGAEDIERARAMFLQLGPATARRPGDRRRRRALARLRRPPAGRQIIWVALRPISYHERQAWSGRVMAAAPRASVQRHSATGFECRATRVARRRS